MKKFTLSIAMLSMLCISLFAGPFGIEFGMTLEDVKNVATVKTQGKLHNFMYFITPSKASTFFDDYRIMVSPKFGVFEIQAYGNIINSDEYGEKIRDEFEKVKVLVSKTYGPPTDTFDFLKVGSIWKEPREWLIALRKDERVYGCYWMNNKKDTNLPEPLEVVYLGIHFLNDYDNKCYLVLTYQPSWFSEAIEDAEAEESSVF
jgi:hypothetical protein